LCEIGVPLNLEKGASKNGSERVERKAPGAQEAGHIKTIGELPSTAQRGDRAAQ
jgi:hypothetical protein